MTYRELQEQLEAMLKEMNAEERERMIRRECDTERLPIIKCECGGEKLGLPHSDWCVLYGTNFKDEQNGE